MVKNKIRDDEYSEEKVIDHYQMTVNYQISHLVNAQIIFYHVLGYPLYNKKAKRIPWMSAFAVTVFTGLYTRILQGVSLYVKATL